MNVEAIIVCKDYADFLEHTLPENLQQLDHIIVATSPEDRKTQELCRKYSVQCIQTTVFTEYGDQFAKSRAINLLLSNCRKDGWILHLDADIMVCRDFRRMLGKAQLNPKNIYGADRINVYGYESWMKLKPFLTHHYDSRWFVDPGFCHQMAATDGINMRMGARVIHEEHGYVPIGYFQLWHPSTGRRYNYRLGSAAGSDVCFPVQWARENRVLLPDVVCWHLDSEETHGIGTNWKGRKSRPFAPCPPKHAPHKNHGPHHHHRPHYGDDCDE